MGEGALGVSADGDVARVSGEIETLRHDLGRLVAELDRRRREAFDVRLQLRRHPVAVAIAAAAGALVLGGLLAVASRGRRERRRPVRRAFEARRALGRIFDHPERVGAHPSMGHKVATAVLTVVATTLARRMIAGRR